MTNQRLVAPNTINLVIKEKSQRQLAHDRIKKLLSVMGVPLVGEPKVTGRGLRVQIIQDLSEDHIPEKIMVRLAVRGVSVQDWRMVEEIGICQRISALIKEKVCILTGFH